MTYSPTDKILLSTSQSYIAPYLISALRPLVKDPAEQIRTLGPKATDDIEARLDIAPVSLPETYAAIYHIASDGSDNARRIDNLLNSFTDADKPHAIVYIASTDVYDLTEGTDIGEDYPIAPTSERAADLLKAEQTLASGRASLGIACAILRCAPTVGTGMTGALRRLVNSIWRGNYMHVADETARMSVVHATDVAAAAIALCGTTGTFNVTDGADPSRHDLAEALAHRMAGKRILTIAPARAKRLASVGRYLPVTGWTPQSLQRRYRTLTFSNRRLIDATGLAMTAVIDYLRTHVYDENSL